MSLPLIFPNSLLHKLLAVLKTKFPQVGLKICLALLIHELEKHPI